jgi:hypothetical protein
VIRKALLFARKPRQMDGASANLGSPIQQFGVGVTPADLPALVVELLKEVRGIEFITRAARIERA